MEGFQVLTLEDVVSCADIFVITTGGRDIIMVDHMRKMKNAIVCNIGHFNNEVDMHELETYPGIERITMKLQTDKYVFPDTKSGIIVMAEGHLMDLGCATGNPSLVMSCSFTNQVIAQLELWKKKKSGKYRKKIHVLPKHLDEKVAALHLGKLGVKLTKEQADYINVPSKVLTGLLTTGIRSKEGKDSRLEHYLQGMLFFLNPSYDKLFGVSPSMFIVIGRLEESGDNLERNAEME
ncbi:hypothetical protein Nepgr_020451 [Nepenthes gracilis]|uniref:Adenosylhomocysteinase n=1 Tax=Nepenthes gracilis TaxID=150966 RepID=A0AAD3SWW3_NEPGR|nr:hypothetical protein Nepgr_020451 [Nepenthes gracilis]